MCENMWLIFFGFCVLLVKTEDVLSPPTDNSTTSAELQNITAAAEKKMSKRILEILDHFKRPDPVGIPGVPIPDPMVLPDMKQSFSLGTMNFKNQKLYGLKNFRISHITADINALKVESSLTIELVTVEGNYTLSSWFSRSRGPFIVQLQNVKVTAVARLDVERSGQLEAQEIDMDISFEKISMNFTGIGALFQNIMNSVGTFIFNSIKPFVLAEANKNIRDDVNKQVKKLPMTFPNSISPFDGLICDVRQKLRSIGLDPYKVPDYNNTVGILDVYLTNTWLYGISSFHRTKDIIVEMRNRTVHFLVQVGTSTLKGTSNWDISLVAGIMSKYGSVAFSLEYIRVTINASQSLDTSKSPVLDDIQIELGNIQIRFDGLGTVDYAVELGVNVLPNLLRYQIMDALEKPIKLKVQEALDQVNIEQYVKDNSEKLDSMNSLDEFKLDSLVQ